nr:hypothetical protein [Tanacetum cinerariifolium]
MVSEQGVVMGSESVFVQPAIPMFDGHYDHWSRLMENFLRSKEYWDLVETCITSPIEGREGLTQAEKKAINAEKLKDLKCKNYLFQAIERSILATILKKDTSKEIWDSLKQKFQGTAQRKKWNVYIIKKILRSMTSRYDYVVCSIEESNDLDTMSIDMLQSSILIHEQRMGRQVEDEQALQVTHQEGRGHFQWECPKEVKSTAYYTEAKEEMLLMSLVECKQTTYEHLWFFDSGCSNHMCGNKDMFVDLDSMFKESVKLRNNSTLTEKGLGVSIFNGICKIFHAQKGVILETKMTSNKMFPLYACYIPEKQQCFSSLTVDQSNFWHHRYGHLSWNSLNVLQRKNMVKGLPRFTHSQKVCEDCLVGKQHRNSFQSKSTWRASDILQLVHADLCGPVTPVSNSKKRYVITFTDDFSRKTWIYFLAEKSKAFATFKLYKVKVEKETRLSIRDLRTDRGGEFTSLEFQSFCNENGIQRQLTAAYTPQQNGVAERKNRTIINMVRSVLSAKKVPKTFWPEAVNWAVHVLNRSPTLALKDTTLKEAWIKLNAKSLKCIFFGVSDESKAYRLFDPTSNKILISRDVVFEEDQQWSWDDSHKQAIQVDLEWEHDEEQAEAESLSTQDEASTHTEMPPIGSEGGISSVTNAPVQHRRHDMDQEIQAIERNNTWELTTLPSGGKSIGVKWVFKTKLNENEEVDNYKARLVAKGYCQEYGYDYAEVFAPVAPFLHGEIKEEVFIDQPPGYELKGKESKVYRLKKALYGLKQAPRACRYLRFLRSQTMNEFDMTNLGKMRYFLVHNPAVHGLKLTKDEEGTKVDGTIYRQIVGSLMYLTNTRPDLMFIVSMISRYMKRPIKFLLAAAKRVLRYVKGTINLGVFYRKGGNKELELIGFTNSDYAGDLDDRKSTSGYVFLMSCGVVSWCLTKQPVVTLSITEAEFIAAASSAFQVVWLRRILECLSQVQQGPTVDYTSAIRLSRNPVMRGRSKHIDARFHFLRELVNDGVVELIQCSTQEQVADILTKPLKLDAFVKLRQLLGVCEDPDLN